MTTGTNPGASSTPTAALEHAWISNWETQLYRSDKGSPLLPVEFVAGQGSAVRLIDVRDPQDFIGPLGYIPGSDWIPPERLDSLPGRLGPESPLVVVSRHGERASEVARMLEGRGLRLVAAMGGGVSQWLSLGFGTTRDPAILDLCDVLRPIEPPACTLGDAHSLSIEQVEAHLGDPLSVRWIKLAALVLHAHLSCIDGRDDRGIIGTPGGDAGQFLLGLAAIENTLGRRLDPGVIATLLERRIDTLGGFYMHTDHHALQAATESMRHDPRLASVVDEFDEPGEWRQFFRRPPLALREAVLEHLCQASAIGCGHLRLMHQHAADYRIRPGLVLDFLQAFYHARWEGAFRAEYELLHGRHNERAVLNTQIEGPLQPFTLIPLVSPSCSGCQMFVNHTRASEYLLNLLVDFLMLQTDLIPEFARDLQPALIEEVDALHAIHVKNSLGHLARGLPIYDVLFTNRGQVHVAFAGVVG
jgi:rhodanese-related sulfurtransferase